MTKKCKALSVLMLLTMLLSCIVLPASAASDYLTGSSNGVTLEAGSYGYLPFTIHFPMATQPGFPGFPGMPGYPTDMPIISGAVGVIGGVSATLNSVNNMPYTLVGSSTITFGQMLRGSSTDAAFEVEVPADADPGKYTATVTVGYTFYPFITGDENNPFGSLDYENAKSGSITIDIPLTVVNPKYEALTGKDIFDITRREIPDRVSAGDNFTVALTVKNQTGYKLENLTVSLSNLDGCYFEDDTSIKTLNILPNSSARATFNLRAADSATAGSRQVCATVSYLNPAGETVSREFYMLLNVDAAAAALPADVKVTSFTLPETIKAGEPFTASVTVQNTSEDKTAESLTLSLEQQSGLQTRSATKLTLPTLAPGESATLNVEYAAPATAASAYCVFTAKYSYLTQGQTAMEQRSQDNGTYLSEREKPSLEITGISIPTSVKSETDFTLSVTVRNNGGPAENLYFSIEPDAGFVYKSSTSKVIKSLATGESTTLSFKLFGSSSISEGYKSIRLSCTQNGDTLIDEYTGTNMIVPEKTDENAKNDVPVLIISSYDFGDEVFGGQTFTLKLEFRNTSKTTAAKDLKITVSSSSDDGVTAFTPANSSNTFFVDELAPGETVTQSIDLLVKGDLSPKSYGIYINLEYKNPVGTSESANETLAIPVKQETRFNIGEISSLTDITTMEEAYLTATFGNLGKSTIYNVIVKVTGEGFSCYSPEYYAGNIEAGKHLTNDFYLAPNGPGAATGTITYTYEDANGEKFTETQEFSFNITESMNNNSGGTITPTEPVIDPETGYMYDETTGQWIDPATGEVVDDPTADSNKGFLGLPVWVWIAIGGGVAVVTVIIVVVCVKRAKKRKQEDEDADL